MEILKVISQNGGLEKKIELNKPNAEIKKIYAQVKRSSLQNLCEKLDYRTSNTKLWKLAKQIDNLKPSNKEKTLSLVIMQMSRWMLGKQQRPWISIMQMKVGLLLVVLTSTSRESPEIK
ncbi:hypothetical protein TNCV_1335171 [Trichonephila clavipes]|nr:hypothetical protein TNCV_1335171 [Trichonephila clavipes]